MSTIVALVVAAGLLNADPEPFEPGPFLGAGAGGAYTGRHDGDGALHRGIVVSAFEAGALLRLRSRRRLRIAISGVVAPEFVVGGYDINSELDFRARIRLGGTRGRLFGFGIVGLGAALEFVDGGDYFGSGLVGPTAELGGGLQGRLGQHFALGAELVAHSAYKIGWGVGGSAAARLTLTWYWPRGRHRGRAAPRRAGALLLPHGFLARGRCVLVDHDPQSCVSVDNDVDRFMGKHAVDVDVTEHQLCRQGVRVEFQLHRICQWEVDDQSLTEACDTRPPPPYRRRRDRRSHRPRASTR